MITNPPGQPASNLPDAGSSWDGQERRRKYRGRRASDHDEQIYTVPEGTPSDSSDGLVYVRMLQRLQSLRNNSDTVVAEEINDEIELIVRLMVHPSNSPASAHRWAWRPA